MKGFKLINDILTNNDSRYTKLSTIDPFSKILFGVFGKFYNISNFIPPFNLK